ncbi:MAG: ABC transporter ATP-binding protein [Lachnospiraceae bacterium]|nr:ABC transporter ATP-binding protein [Lachnospiraceae bacterium]
MVYKRIFAEVKEYKLPSFLTPVCMILEVIFETIIPLLIAKIVDVGIGTGSIKAILYYGGLMLLCAVLGLLAGIGGGVFGAKASTGLAKNLRSALFSHIQTFSFANIDKFSTSGLVTRLTTDVTNIQNAYQMMLRMFFRAPISLIVALVMAFSINARLAQVYLYAVIFLAVLIGSLMGSTSRIFMGVFQKYDDLNKSVEENVSAIRVVKSYVREEHETGKFRRAAENIYKLFLRAEKRVIFMSPIMSTTVYTCIILISWIGAKMIVSHEGLTTGELMSMLTYCMYILMSLMFMAMIFIMVIMSTAAAKRISEVLNETSTITDPENPVTEIADGSIDFDDVDFAYTADAHEAVLKDVTLHIRSGETVGIIGGTGSAKTTLVSLISRLYDTTAGDVMVGGRNVREYSLSHLHDAIAVVLQKNELFSGTILDNLRWGNPDATEEECREACRMACADDFIMRFPDGYETKIEQGGTNVSGGQKQRLCIARALLKKPKVLILDDSTSAVDTATDARIRKSMKEAIPGTTKLIIAQRIASVQDADRVIVMDGGRVSGFDTPENLLKTNAIYREVYETQTSGGGDFDVKGGDL